MDNERNSRFKAASSNRGRITGTIERKHGFSRIDPTTLLVHDEWLTDSRIYRRQRKGYRGLN